MLYRWWSKLSRLSVFQGEKNRRRSGRPLRTILRVEELEQRLAPAVNIIGTKVVDITSGAVPGNTLSYTTTIQNTGSTDALNAQFQDILDSNTTLVPGSVHASPLAFNDSYTDVGNTQLVVGGASATPAVLSATKLTANDVAITDTFDLTTGTFATSQGGSVTINASADGSFVYTPKTGFTGTDTFTYTLKNHNVPSLTDTGTVTITVSNRVWYVDSSAAAGGDGSSALAFKTLPAVSAVDAANDFVSVKNNGSNYASGFTLKAGEQLIGSGVNLVVGGFTLSTATSNATITNAAGAGITLAEGNTIAGLTVSAPSGVGITGSGVNAATIDATVNVTGATGGAFSLSGGNGTVAFGATVTNSSNHSVSIQNRTGGTVTLSGSISDTGTGILLNNNTGATINFTGGLSLTTTTNLGFTATGGGTVSVIGANNTITTTTATALNVANTTIGASNLNFKSITSTTASANSGIVLNTTGGSGGLVVTGVGATAGSGGSISNKTVAGISLTSTSNVSLSNMNIQNNGAQAIKGTGVKGFSLTGGSITGNNGSSVASVDLTDTTGAVSFVNDTVTGTTSANGCGVELHTTPASTAAITTLTVTGGSYSNNTQNDGFLVDLGGGPTNSASIGAAFFSGVTFSGNFAKGLQLQQNNNAVFGDSTTAALPAWGGGIPNGSVTVTGCTFTNNDVAASFEAGGGTGGTGSVYYRFVNNLTITGSHSVAVNFANGSDSGGGTFKAFISGNHIGTNNVPNSGSAIGEGIRVFLQGQQAATVTITNNVIRALSNGPPTAFSARGIDVEELGRPGANFGQTPLDVKITGNDVDTQDTSGFPQYAIYVAADAQGTGTSGSNVHAEIHGNTVPATGAFDTQAGPTIGMIFYETVSGATGTTTGTLFNFSGSGASVSSEIANTNTGTAGKTCSFVNGGSLTLTGTAPNTVALLADPTGGVPVAPTPGAVAPSSPTQTGQLPASSDGTVAVSPPSDVTTALTQNELNVIVSAALQRWELAGLTVEQVAALQSASYTVSSALPSGYLGAETPGHVDISSSAGGYGWFVDATPLDDVEFPNTAAATRLYTTSDQAPAGHFDLLTTVEHEMGHLLGLEDHYDAASRNDLMFGYITFGERRLPGVGEADGAVPGSQAGVDFLGLPLTIGTLPAGKTVTVVFQTTINNPVTGSPTQISNTGTISGSNFANVSTTTATTNLAVPTVTVNATSQPITATSVIIAGTNFDPTPANDSVTFNLGAIGTVTTATTTSLTVTFSTLPTSVGNLTAVVSLTNGLSSGAAKQVATVVPVVTLNATSQPVTTTTVTISGAGFSATPAQNVVTFNLGAAGNVTAATATQLTVSFTTQPTVAGNLTAVVTTNTFSSGAAVQVATVTPVVTTTSAALPFNATTITIGGFGFSTTAGNNTVAFNLGAAGNVTAATATSLTVTFTTNPTSLGNLTAIVTTNGHSSGAAVQVATVVPAVTVSATALPITTTTLVINGAGFSATPAQNVVTFNLGAAGTVTASTATSLTVSFTTQPTSVGNLTAIVTTNGFSSAPAVQVATVIPVVNSSVAALPITTTTLVINGAGFSTTLAQNVVTFNLGAAGNVTAATTTQLTVTFTTQPTSVGNLTASVTTSGVSSGAAVQVTTVVPVVTSSVATLPITTTTLTINGHGFSATPAQNVVTFNLGAVGTVTAATTTQLTVTFTTQPTSVGNLTAVVATNTFSSGAAVQVATVIPLVTSSVTALPITTTTLTINGNGFDTTPGNNVVTFNLGAVGTVTAATATQLTVTFSTQPTSVGNLTAIVSTNGFSSGAAVQVATVIPVVTMSTAQLLNTATTVTINGAGFSTTPLNNTVAFNLGAVGTVTAATTTQLTVTFTTQPGLGNLTAVVTTSGFSSGAAVQVATVIALAVTSSTAPLAQNAPTIIINGNGFSTTTSNDTVVLDDGAVGAVTAATSTQMTVTFSIQPVAHRGLERHGHGRCGRHGRPDPGGDDRQPADGDFQHRRPADHQHDHHHRRDELLDHAAQ